jgi:hypothetical protein
MTVAATRFEEFEVEARAQGFDELLECPLSARRST